MGLSYKQFYILLFSLIGIVIYSGLVFQIIDLYGKIWGVISLNILNITFFIFLIFNIKKGEKKYEIKE